MTKLNKTIFVICGLLLLVVALVTMSGGLLVKKNLVPQISYQVSVSDRTSGWVKKNNQKALESGLFGNIVKEVDSDTQNKVLLEDGEFMKDSMLGNLVIPNRQISMPILAGTSDENMLMGAATVSANQQMGKQNYVIVSHNNPYGSQSPMRQINTVKMGDLIYITDFDQIYIYQVTYAGIVDQTDLTYVAVPNFNEKPVLTMYRCAGDVVGSSKRYLVQGELAKVKPLNEAKNDELEGLSISISSNENSNQQIDGEPLQVQNTSTRTVMKTIEFVSIEVKTNPRLLVFGITVTAFLFILQIIVLVKPKWGDSN